MTIIDELEHLKTTMLNIRDNSFKHQRCLYEIMKNNIHRKDDIAFGIALLCCIRYNIYFYPQSSKEWFSTSRQMYDELTSISPQAIIHIHNRYGVKIVFISYRIKKMGFFAYMHYDNKIYNILSVTKDNYTKPESWLSSIYSNLSTFIQERS